MRRVKNGRHETCYCSGLGFQNLKCDDKYGLAGNEDKLGVFKTASVDACSKGFP